MFVSANPYEFWSWMAEVRSAPASFSDCVGASSRLTSTLACEGPIGLRAFATPLLPRPLRRLSGQQAGRVLELSTMGRAGIEPATLGLKVPCSTN
jgi:hypothetical protein